MDHISKAMLAACVCLLALSACASKKNAAGAGGSAGSSLILGSGGSANGTGNGGNGTTVVRDDAGNCVIQDDGSGCTGQAYEGETIPLDIYVMFDQSGSMCSCVNPVGPDYDQCTRSNGVTTKDPDCTQTRMDAVREALRLFMIDPASAGIGLGIGYFGNQEIGQASCNVADYSTAAEPIAALPGNTTAVADSLAAAQPMGETPTGPAINGACQYADSWKAQNPSHEVVILLLTDGKPEAPVTCPAGGTCCPTLDQAVTAAGDCLATGVKTYVLGVGPLLGNLAQIATAGGTDHAYLVESGDIQAQVLDALNTIRGDAIPCQLQIPAAPAGQDLDYNLVNITYASPTCEPSFYYNVTTVSGCTSSGGWYYDNPTAPTQINLCPTSCDQVGVPGGRLLYTLGCTTRIQPH